MSSRGRQQSGGLLQGEQLGRPTLGRAMHPQAGRGRTPLLGPAPGVAQIDEGLAGEERPFARKCTVRSTRGLSWGGRTRAGSIANPRAWAYSTNAWFNLGSSGFAPSTIGRHVVRDHRP